MTTYSISLDDVDLALLPVRSRSNDFLKKEHYEFQIMARDRSASDEYYKCHICALDVPAAYTREHWASVKHRANARIATVATKRMRSLITSPPIVPTNATSGKYCEACSATVGGNHEKSKEHKIAVIQDRMLVDLMKVYVGDGVDDDDDDDDEDKTIVEVNGFAEPTFDVTVDTNAKEKGDEKIIQENVANGNNKNTHNITPTSEIVEISEELTDTLQNNKEVTTADKHVKIETEAYIKLLGNFAGHSEIVFRAIGDRVQIMFGNECVEVTDDNFHSYFRMKGKIQCRVCCETLNPDTEDTHKLTKIHMERVSAAVADSHCVRKIYDDWSHCIICNQVMKTSAVPAHNQTKNHYDRKQEATTKKKQYSQELANQPSTSKSISYHKTYQTKMSFGDKIEHPYEKRTPMSVFCVICQCDVPIKLSNRVDHLKGMRHMHSLKNANKFNKNPA